MNKIVSFRVLSGYRLWLRYADGVEGEVDLSDLAGRGVFEAWNERRFFEAARLDESGTLVWGNSLDLCPDALYLRLTGKSPEEVFPNLKGFGVHARD
jgi:hypothetical protein